MNYSKAGVNIDLGNRLKSSIPNIVKNATRPEVLGKIGGFGGLFKLDTSKYKNPVLVSSTDGVGSKLKLAFKYDTHYDVAHDLVNHCVNDIIVTGAEPLFFLDYIGMNKLDEEVFNELLLGFSDACSYNNCALIGGETAQLPDLYAENEYDLSGTIVGVVDQDKILDGSKVIEGDYIIGLQSNGLHTNGYTYFNNMPLLYGSGIVNGNPTIFTTTGLGNSNIIGNTSTSDAKIETGRVEKGSESDQEFGTSYEIFNNTLTFFDIEFLPRILKDKNESFSQEICDEIIFEVYPLLRLLVKFNE